MQSACGGLSTTSGRDDAVHFREIAAKEYADLFARSGMAQPGDDPQTVAKQIDRSDVERALVAALDDWAVCEPAATRREWVLQVAQLASGSGTPWEKLFRDSQHWSDRERLLRLAEPVATAGPTVTQFCALGDRLAAAGLDASAFRYRVQQEHVDSFLANLMLADMLCATEPAEAVRYYQAVLAIRPRSATAHNNLAVALAKLGRSAEALRELKAAQTLDRTSPRFAATSRALSGQSRDLQRNFAASLAVAVNSAIACGSVR